MAKKDFYEQLGINKGASDAEIKSAFRQKAREFHPDVNKDAGAQDKFKEVNEAYQALGDEQKRKAYDQFGSNYQQAGGFSAGGGPAGCLAGAGSLSDYLLSKNDASS